MLNHISSNSRPSTPAGVIARLRGFLNLSTPPETPEQAGERRERERAAAGAEMARLKAQADAELPKLAEAEEKARRHLETLKPGYQDAIAAFDRAQTVHSRRAHDIAYATQLATRRIEAAAEPLIAEFCSDLMELFQATIQTPVEDEDRNPMFADALGRMVFEVWSNAPSINARRIAILAARNQAEEMKVEADQSNIRERLIAMVEALPDADTMVKVRDYPSLEERRPWPSYKQSREEFIGREIEDDADRRRGIARAGGRIR